MRSRKVPSRERTLGRFIRHLLRVNRHFDRAEAVRVGKLQFPTLRAKS